MLLDTTVKKMCLNSAHKHLYEIKEDLCGSAGPLNSASQQEKVIEILEQTWNNILAL